MIIPQIVCNGIHHLTQKVALYFDSNHLVAEILV